MKNPMNISVEMTRLASSKHHVGYGENNYFALYHSRKRGLFTVCSKHSNEPWECVVYRSQPIAHDSITVGTFRAGRLSQPRIDAETTRVYREYLMAESKAKRDERRQAREQKRQKGRTTVAA